MYKTIFLCLASVFFNTLSLFANYTPDIQKQIKKHNKWVEVNVPLPDTLSQERLFVETAKAIVSSCLEDRYVNIIKYAGEKYKLTALIEYAELRKRKAIDKDDYQARKCLKLLLDKSNTTSDNLDYSAAYISMCLVLTAPEQKEQEEWIIIFYESTKQLFDKDNSPKNEELWLFAQFLKESGGSMSRYENPLTYKVCRLLSTSIIKFYARTHIISEIRAYQYEQIDNYFTNCTLYPNYQAYINKKLAESNDSVLTGHFPLLYLTEDKSDILLSDTIDFTGAAIKILENYYHEFHPDVIGLRLLHFSLNYNTPKVTEETIKGLVTFCKNYYGDNSVEYASANSSFRAYSVWKGDLKEIDFSEDLEIESSFLSKESEAFLSILEKELATQVFCDQTDQAQSLIRSIDEIAKKKYYNDIIQELSYHGQYCYFQKKGIVGYESAFDDLCQTYIDNCDDNISFNAVGLGKTLANTTQTIFNDPMTTLTLQRKILQLLGKLIGKQHPLFAFEYIQYGQLVASTYPSDALTIEGENDEEALFSDIISTAKQFDSAEFAMMVAGRRKFMEGLFSEARYYYKQAINIIENKSQLVNEKESNRYYLAGLYSNIIQTFSGNQMVSDSVDFYGKKLIDQFATGFIFNPNFHSDIYSTLASYYMQKNQYRDAENILNKCLEYYDTNPNMSVDGFYIQVMQGLISLYGNVYNDMDKCLLLAEKIERDIDKIKDLGNAETHIGLLRTLYDLVEYKNPYDLLLLAKYLQSLTAAITHYEQTSKNEMVKYNHGLYLFTKLVRFARDEPQYRAMVTANSSEEDFDTLFWMPLKKNLIDSIIPELLDMKEQMELKFPFAYRQSPIYQQIIYNLAIATQRCMNNIKQAENYYIQLSQCNEQMGLLQLGNFYLENNDIKNAAQTFSQCEKNVEQFENGDVDGLYSAQRSQIYSRFFMAYYRNGDYNKALNAANNYYDNTQIQINANFDLFTQAEREAFLMQYGAGGTPLQYLLPHLGNQISSKVYDVLLQEKGLLLRASEKIRQSILASSNDTLVHAIDSLKAFRQELSLLANIPESQNRAIELREKYDKLERYIARESKPFRTKEDEVPNWQQVCDGLMKGEAAIEFVVTDSVAMALVITPEISTPQSVVLMQYDDMKALFDIIMSNKDDMSELADQLYNDDTMHLYEKIWEPIEKYVNDTQIIYYSLSGFLNILSFAAIPLPNEGNLIDKYELHQLTTTGLLAHRGKRTNKEDKKKSARLFGAIFYSDEQQKNDSSFITKVRSQKDNNALLLASNQRGAGNIIEEFPFPFLGNTLIECDNITKLLKNNNFDVKESVGDIPTESEIRKLDGHSSNIIHFSTHGFFVNSIEKAKTIPFFKRFNELNSMSCTGLLLANSEMAWLGYDIDLNENNLLSSSEISALRLDNTELVVLSACETALGAVGSEGVFGLQRGFKQAGVKTICASLWSINDLSTAQLMESFYRLWLQNHKGRDMQKAMREAMLEQRAKTSSPKYWAPFVLYDADL